MGLVKEILRIASDHPGGYGLIYELIYKEKVWQKVPSKATISSTISRLKNKGLLENKNGIIKITASGKNTLVHSKNDYRFKKSGKNPKRTIKKTTMVLFDIPEKKRKYRDWIRRELVLADFEIIQKSAWFGPGISKEFIKQLEEYDLLDCVRFFKVKEDDLI